MNENEMLALFLLAGIDVLASWKLANDYWPDDPEHAQRRNESPWWLVRTKYGMIRLGWRKRVIAIDWKDTALRTKTITRDDVTTTEYMVHAWSYAKAVEYLTTLGQELSKVELILKSTEDGIEEHRRWDH